MAPAVSGLQTQTMSSGITLYTPSSATSIPIQTSMISGTSATVGGFIINYVAAPFGQTTPTSGTFASPTKVFVNCQPAAPTAHTGTSLLATISVSRYICKLSVRPNSGIFFFVGL